MNLQSRPWQLGCNIGIAVAVALLAAACGYDNRGEPRAPAEELSAPNLGDVHVYCVESQNVRVTACSVDLAAGAGHSPAELQRWWLRAAHALHAAGTFHYMDGDWRFEGVFIEARDNDGAKVDYGWGCRGDERHANADVVKLMVDRVPGGPSGIGSLAAAQAKGCTIARVP